MAMLMAGSSIGGHARGHRRDRAGPCPQGDLRRLHTAFIGVAVRLLVVREGEIRRLQQAIGRVRVQSITTAMVVESPAAARTAAAISPSGSSAAGPSTDIPPWRLSKIASSGRADSTALTRRARTSSKTSASTGPEGRQEAATDGSLRGHCPPRHRGNHRARCACRGGRRAGRHRTGIDAPRSRRDVSDRAAKAVALV